MIDPYSTKPIEEVNKLDFKNIRHNRNIVVSPHAVDHLSERQRKVFKDEELINMISKETPRKVYLQKNGRYAAYYRKSDGYRKLILQVEDATIKIVTFMDPPEIPKYKFKND
jgi:mRNA-degrading endonuclease RelE of RelBE toxin-antitoxin system